MSHWHEGELERAHEQYVRRDATGRSEWSWSDPEYVLWIQHLERQFLRVLEEVQVRLPSTDVLDVGCGTGYFTNRMVDYGALSAVGLDLSPARVQSAHLRYPALEFVAASATEMPFEARRFGLVTQFMCLSSVLDADARRAICAEIRRVTKPQGVFVSFDLRPRRIARQISRRLRTGSGAPEEIMPVPVSELEEMLGLRASSVRQVGFPLEARSVLRSVPAAEFWSSHFPLPVHQLVAFRMP